MSTRTALAALAVLVAPSLALAETPPGTWEAVKDPAQRARYELHLEVMTDLTKRDALEGTPFSALVPNTAVHDALDKLLAAGAETSPDVRLRFDLGRVYEMLGNYAAGARVLSAALALAPDHPMVEDALWQLAICYAHGDAELEIATYDRYLELATHPGPRAIAFSNRAEAEMRLGRLREAIDDATYATTIGADSEITTLALMDLAVALDRSGDQHGAIAAADRALADPQAIAKVMSDGPGVFFVPDYDKHWYRALVYTAMADGHRSARELRRFFVRSESDARARASLEWQAYLRTAEIDDRWLPIARRREDDASKKLKALGGPPKRSYELESDPVF